MQISNFNKVFKMTNNHFGLSSWQDICFFYFGGSLMTILFCSSQLSLCFSAVGITFCPMVEYVTPKDNTAMEIQCFLFKITLNSQLKLFYRVEHSSKFQQDHEW